MRRAAYLKPQGHEHLDLLFPKKLLNVFSSVYQVTLAYSYKT